MSSRKYCTRSRFFGLWKQSIPCTTQLVAICDNYWRTTNYPTTGTTTYWVLRFYRCERCGRRWSDHNCPFSVDGPLKESLKTWTEAGILPTESYHPSSKGKTPEDIEEVDTSTQATLNGIVSVLKIVLDRDIDLEERYPSLKRIADEYHRELDKCKTVEALRGPGEKEK